jgi:hypothetical protein
MAWERTGAAMGEDEADEAARDCYRIDCCAAGVA